MKVSFKQVQNVFKTLPTGYYLGRKIETVLDTSGRCYYDKLKDKIVVGYNAIAKLIDPLPDTADEDEIEEMVRNAFYHEVGHVVWTSARVANSAAHSSTVNILEDERMECLGAQVFKGTDFRRAAVYAGKEMLMRQDKEAAWYRFCRFRQAPTPELAKDLDKLIKKYAHINGSSRENNYYDENLGRWVYNDDPSIAYLDDINALYRKFCKVYDQQQQEQKNQQDQKNQQSNRNNQNPQEDDDQDQDEDNKTPQSNGGKKPSGNNKPKDEKPDEKPGDGNNGGGAGDGDGQDKAENNSNKDSQSGSAGEEERELTPEEQTLEAIAGNAEGTDLSDYMSLEQAQADFEDMCKNIGYFDKRLFDELTECINQKMKKRNNLAGACNSYSGFLDIPSVLVRQDYRWWVTQNRLGNLNRCTKVHFVLMIDSSGSMSGNEHKINTFIQTLRRIPSKDFTFDVITVDTAVHEWQTLDKEYTCPGGTRITKDMISRVMKKHTKKDAANYYFLLVDGSINVATDSCGFAAMTTPNCIIVTDARDNGSRIRDLQKNGRIKAKTVYTKDFTNKFFENVISLLKQALV